VIHEDLDEIDEAVDRIRLVADTFVAALAVETARADAAEAQVVDLTARLAACEASHEEPAELWHGHQPGRTYIGMSRGNFYAGNHGTRRSFRSGWSINESNTEHQWITEDHAANRLPWTSNKSPGTWAQVASGQHDSTMRLWAQRHGTYTKPLIWTFHHEPFGDASGSAADFVAATHRILDLWEQEAPNVVVTPVLHGHNIIEVGDQWLSDEMIERCPFIGIDTYRPLPEIVAQMNYLKARGVTAVGIAETHRGPADSGGTQMTLDQFQAKLDHFKADPDFYQIITYFNSSPFGGFRGTWPNGAAYQAIWDPYAAGSARL
jgi:hypothetical protein